MDMSERWNMFQYQRKIELKVENQGKKKEEFQRQMNEIVRDDAIMQRLNLMMILPEKKTTIEPVLTLEYKIELLFEKRKVLSCLMENLKIHISGSHQQKMWTTNLRIILDVTTKLVQSWDQRRFWDEVYSPK